MRDCIGQGKKGGVGVVIEETKKVKLETRKGPVRLSGVLFDRDFASKINRREG